MNPRGMGSEAVSMRLVFWRTKRDFSHTRRKQWPLRFLQLRRRPRFRLAELTRDPFELHLAFKGPLARGIIDDFPV